ncbi:MAG: [protein-PII] uridylyltransferase [Alphaproteobacteria bacterium]|nr:[protein-PII] uridylyltransferase [Alphaproteobacteria bacterium]
MNVIAKQRDIVDRRAIVARLDAIVREHGAEGGRGEILALLKQTLSAGRIEIRKRFDDHNDGRACMRANAFLIDQIIRLLYDFAFETAYPLSNPTQGERIAVVAVGGYGRGELAPFSDVDLLFVLNYKLSPHSEQVIEYILYMLWDLGLKVGHATRSIDECLRMAAKDLTIRTALLESRFLWGDNHIYAEFRRRYLATIGADSGLEFVDAKLAERDARHHKMGDTRYVLEPNIKEGKGGLRDLHTLYWIAKYLYRVDEIRDLIDKSVFSPAEAARFRKAHEFLRAVRCHLHYIAGRGEERLTFDHQQTIAKLLGFNDRKGVMGVERFMRYYYLIAKEVGDLTRIFCAALEIAHRRQPRFRLPFFTGRARDLDGFVAERGWLKAASETAFVDDPVNFIRLFAVAQTHGLDIHPASLRQITQNLKKIDESLRIDEEANRLFLDILTSKNDPATALKRLNEAGVLGRFIPDFGRVVAQMQYDMYHVYTVDEHTIQAIGLLASIERGEQRREHPLASELLPTIGSRRALYIAVLLHDIAKGRGGNHSELGADVARKVCPTLGLSDEETETVEWLVRQHLAMSNVAQKRDLSDSKTISDFAELVQSLERLRLLLCLTVVDMRATGPNVWNNWKAELLRELYYATEDVLSGGQLTQAHSTRVEAAKDALRTRLTDWPEADIEAQFGRGYPGYWLTFDAETHERQARIMRAAEVEARPLTVETRVVGDLDVTEVTIYTQDHPGLFSRIAGAFAAVGANVVDAKVFTTPEGMVLDVFWLQDHNGRAFAQTSALARMSVQIERALAGEMKRDEAHNERTFVPERTRVFTVAPRVIIDNQASATHTVIEINGRDRPGFLYSVTRALYSLSLQISSSKISTYGERAVDVFYVKDGFGMKVTHEDRSEKIRKTLLDAIGEVDDALDQRSAAAE